MIESSRVMMRNVADLPFYATVSYVVGVDGAEALQGGGEERDVGRTTDVLHPLHLTDAPLGEAVDESQHTRLI